MRQRLGGSFWRYAAITAILCLGIGLSIGTFIWAYHREQRALSGLFDAAAQDRVSAIQAELDAHTLILESVAALYGSSSEVSRQEFRSFVAPLFVRYPDIQALEWIPRIPVGERAAYESAARRDGLEGFQITQRVSQGSMVPELRRDEYFPVYFVEPLRGNESAAGFDLASEPRRLTALHQARDTGRAYATAAITLVQEKESQTGFLIFIPVYSKGAATETVLQRRDHLQGFVLGVFRVGKIVEASLARLVPAGVNVGLHDETDGAKSQLLYYHPSRTFAKNDATSRDQQAHQATGLTYRAALALPERQWSVVCSAAPAFIAAHTTYYPWAVLAMGLAFTLVAGGYLFSATRHSEKQARLAEDLARKNEALNREMESRGQAEESLRNSEERFRSVFEATTDCILVWDREYNYLYANQAAIDHVGASREKVVGRNMRDGLGHLPEFLKLWMSRVDDVFTSGRPMQVEDQSPVGQKEVWSESNLFPIRDASGRIFAVGVVYRNVTARKLAEQALALERNKLKSILDTMNDGVYIVNEAYEVEYVNPVILRELGAPAGRKCYEQMHGLPAPCPDCTIPRVVAGETVTRELHIEKVDRTLELVDVGLRNADGHWSKLTIAHDITSRKHAEVALRKSEERFRKLVESVTDYIYTVEVEDGRAARTSHSVSCISVTGYGAEEYEADVDLWLRMVPAEDRKAVLSQAEKLTAGQPCPPLEHRIVRKDGTVRWVRNTPVLAYDEKGRFNGYEGLIQDITEARRLQEQLLQAQKMEAVGQLAGGVAHDFRNQLTVVKGFAEMLLRRHLVAEGGRDPLNEILKAVERSSVLTNELLAFSRKQVLRPEVIRVDDVIRAMAKPLGQLIGEDVQLCIETRAGGSDIKSDAGQLQQAVINLVLNARDAMPRGGRLTIETARVEMDREYVARHVSAAPGSHVMVAVSDTGAGMDAETLKKAFDPFFTTKPVGQGTGLGLAMVHGFVQQSGGSVAIYSEPGRGTTVKMYFPTVTEISPAARPQESPAPIPAGTETIFLVEDEAGIRKMTAETLREHGYTVHEFANADEALAGLTETQKPIDLLVTDVVMPGIDGVELARRVQSSNPEVKVLYISGYTGKALSQHGLSDKDIPLIVKPFGTRTLLEAVANALAHSGSGTGSGTATMQASPANVS